MLEFCVLEWDGKHDRRTWAGSLDDALKMLGASEAGIGRVGCLVGWTELDALEEIMGLLGPHGPPPGLNGYAWNTLMELARKVRKENEMIRGWPGTDNDSETLGNQSDPPRWEGREAPG